MVPGGGRALSRVRARMAEGVIEVAGGDRGQIPVQRGGQDGGGGDGHRSGSSRGGQGLRGGLSGGQAEHEGGGEAAGVRADIQAARIGSGGEQPVDRLGRRRPARVPPSRCASPVKVKVIAGTTSIT